MSELEFPARLMVVHGQLIHFRELKEGKHFMCCIAKAKCGLLHLILYNATQRNTFLLVAF